MVRISIVFLCLAITECMAFECVQKDGFFKDPANPHKYFECVDGKPYSFTCPENLVFDESKKVCDYDSNAKTGTPGIIPSTPEHHTETTTTVRHIETTTQKQSLDCKGKTGFFVDPTNRHKFHECVNGEVVTFTCPEDLVFDETKSSCVFDNSAVGTTHKPGVDCVGKTGFFVDPTNRHKFHECVNGEVVTFTCPEDLVFDETKSSCVFDNNAVGTTHKPGIDCVGKTGFFKDPQDKHKFHECTNGEMVTFTCPENLVFSETKQACDFDLDQKTSGSTAGHTVGVSTPSQTYRTDIGTQSQTTPTPRQTELPQTEGTRPRHTHSY